MSTLVYFYIKEGVTTYGTLDLAGVTIFDIDELAQAQLLDPAVITQVEVLAIDELNQAQSLDQVVLVLPSDIPPNSLALMGVGV